MKNIILFLLLLFSFLDCRKKNIETTEQTNAQIFETCLKSKEFPNLPKGNIYLEGEIDNKYFCISENTDFGVSCSLQTFYQGGYKAKYADARNWEGNGFDVTNFSSKSQYQYTFLIGLPSFQGDSLAYIRYFDQFQKGKTFRFLKVDDKTTISAYAETGIVTFSLGIVSGCAEDLTLGNSMTSSNVGDQTGSYFRVSDVKEYKSANGQIFKRDVSIEYDVKIGGTSVPLKRIKNGHLFFSY